MKVVMRMAVFATAIALYYSAAHAESMIPQGGIDAVNNELLKRVSMCKDASGESFYFSAVVQPNRPTNNFAPQLEPQGKPEAGTVLGFYQWSLYKYTEGGSAPLPSETRVPITDADKRNGVRERYSVRLSVPSYRIFDMREKRWREWQSARPTGPRGDTQVTMAFYSVEHNANGWVAQGHFFVNDTIVPAKCSELPPL